MSSCDILIRNASVIDGAGSAAEVADVALSGDRIHAIGPALKLRAGVLVDGEGLVLAPGFIDVHTHDDTVVIRRPEMMPKISQGVTTVIVGNCGIGAAPVRLRGEPPDPMNLLGTASDFRFPDFASYLAAIELARPAVNVAALVGHTALRNNVMDRLDRAASEVEVAAMREELKDALAHGALGLSSGLAYLSANAASPDEMLHLAHPLAAAGAVYSTHLRSETETILDAMNEAFHIGSESRIPVVISHLKCAGVDNWGRGAEVLQALETARTTQPAGCDCYPYAAGSSTLDLRQVDERVEITITWSEPHPQVAGRSLAQIAAAWNVPQMEAATRLRPAGAIYHSISEADMRRILAHPATMIGSDGLPNDPRPHPRLWGTFPRVLGHYCRHENLFPLPEAIRKMTGMPAQRFNLAERGLIREGFYADLTLFDPRKIVDRATYADPTRPAKGIVGVWVNGVLSYTAKGATPNRAGRFVPRGKTHWIQ
jgi:N-acyl-D-amino-acid deacylase